MRNGIVHLFERLDLELKRIDRAVLAIARALFLGNGLTAFLLVGLVVTATFSAVQVPYGGSVFRGEGLVILPTELVLTLIALFGNSLLTEARRFIGLVGCKSGGTL